MNSEFYSFAKAVSFIALGVTAFSFGSLIFAFIDRAFPDPLRYGDFFARGLTTSLAALIIAFPLYVFMMWRLAKAMGQRQEYEEPKIATWLTYIVLVALAAAILGDFIAALAEFLRGELTARFALKALTILVITGTIFGYYVWSLQRKSPTRLPVARALGGVVAIAIMVAVGYGLTLAGAPGQQRLIQFDERRVADIQQISYAIDGYWQNNQKLPEGLEDLRDSRSYIQSIHDPKTQEQYEYRQVSETEYELCAVFETESLEHREQLVRPFSETLWEHGVGRTCFPLEVLQSNPPLMKSIPVPAR